MGVAEEQQQGSPRHAHRARPARRGALLGLVTSLAILVAVPVAVSVDRSDPSVGTRPSFASMQEAPGESSPGVSAGQSHNARSNQTAGGSITVLPATPESPANVPRPTRVRVDSVGIDAAVDATGVQPDGTVVIPRDAYRVGWYRFGSAPGSAHGSAVLVGHVDSRTQGRGALYPLRGVQVGDRVTVTVTSRSGDRRDLTYRVVARQSINKQRMPFSELFTRTGDPRLTLITCGGAYLPDRGGYQDNLVVTAIPDGSSSS